MPAHASADLHRKGGPADWGLAYRGGKLAHMLVESIIIYLIYSIYYKIQLLS